MKIKKKLGRPPLPIRQVRTVFPIRLSPQEKALIIAASRRTKENPTTWARNALIQAAS